MASENVLESAIAREVARGWTVEFQSETSARLSNGTQQLTLELDGDAVRYVRTSTGANVPPPQQRPAPSPRQRPPPIPVQVVPPKKQPDWGFRIFVIAYVVLVIVVAGVFEDATFAAVLIVIALIMFGLRGFFRRDD